MAQKLLKFVSIDQEMPAKRAPTARRQDFGEIYEAFDPAGAAKQASRCSQCGIPFCQVHCPLQNNIPDWLMLTAEGRLEEAYELSAATNNFPEICGRICPQDRLCEGHCVIEKGFDAVTIGSVEKYLTDTAWERGWIKPVKPLTELPYSIGIIGAGPGGLAAAEQLRRKGYQAHIYDRYDRVGGLLVYGIPNFKLDKEVVARRHRLLEDGGVVFHQNVEIGKTLSLAELRARHDAVLIATGVYKPRPLQVPGIGLGNIVQALDYLTTSNRRGLGDQVAEGQLDAAGQHVVVIGGGDTAMDCVRTAMRQGALSVKCLYRRDRKNMPGSQREVSHAEEEGVEFVWLSAPQGFGGGDRVESVFAHRIHLGTGDASGRQTPQIVQNSQFTLKADLVILALGFDPEDFPTLFETPELAVDRWGTISVDPASLATSLDGVFAAGDIIRGASLVVWAVRDGRLAADSIGDYVSRRAKPATRPDPHHARSTVTAKRRQASV
jgi:glutamate synthase (NADPH) small chain